MVLIANVAHITVRLYDHHLWCMYLPLLTKGLETYDSSLSTFFVLSANNFFLFVDASKNTRESWPAPRSSRLWHSLQTNFFMSSAVSGRQHIYSHTLSGFMKGLVCPPGLATYGVGTGQYYEWPEKTCDISYGQSRSTQHVNLRLVSSIEATCRDAASSPKMKCFFVCF